MDDENHCSDVDASLMVTEMGISQYKAEQPAAVLIDLEIDEEEQYEDKVYSSLCHEHRETLEMQQQRADGGMLDGGSLGPEHGDSLVSVDFALNREAASEGADSETGARPGPVQQPPTSLLSCPSTTLVEFCFMLLPSKF